MGLQNIIRGFRCVVALTVAAVSSTTLSVAAEKSAVKKTFVDSLIFNYENSIWGKQPLPRQ